MGPGDSIKLSEAPALFFPDDWLRLVSLKDGEEKALEALDHPDPVMIVLSRRQFLEANQNDPEHRRIGLAQEEAYALIDKLISNLRNLGAEGRIVACGLYAGTGQRHLVPAELWREAKLEFGACKLSSGAFVYNYVTVKRAAEPVETIIERMTARLKERRDQQGEESKKVLRAALAKDFGEEFTTRAFNEAYRDCYARPRGRPKKRN
jgi:hypothetical protein